MTQFQFGMVAQNLTEIRESPIIWLPGVDDSLSVQIDGTGTLASATMTLYENGRDISANNSPLPRLTGSTSISGRVIKTKTFTSLVGGNVYKFYISFTDGDVATVREGTIICVKLGVNPSKYPSAINKLRIAESPILIYPGQSLNATMVIDGDGVIASPTMSIYKGTSDFSSTALSGSASVSLRTITLKTIGSLAGGFTYLFYVFFTDNGKPTVRYGEILTPKLGA